MSFGEAFRFWAKLGFISFGGPAGQIAIMHRELVERRRWIDEQRFLHALNFCMLLPGPEAQQLATYLGWLFHGLAGGLVAGVFFVLPSIFVLMILSYIYAAFGSLPAVAALFAGVKPVVVAIVVEAVVRIGRRALCRPAHVAIAAGAFVAIYFLHVPFPLIVLAAGVLAFAGGRLRPRWFTAAPDRIAGAGAGQAAEQLRDLPSHEPPSRAHALRTLAAGAALWVLPFALLVAARGWDSLHARQYRFFTQAALVTFGGAYSVLAYVMQAAVGSYGWLSQAQALDGLALAETTPGPLIMVLQFVGFMACWNHPEGISQAASAVLGALITTWTTFLPCFVFVFLGAPWIEQLRGHEGLTTALSGVTASVVGVILNLALVFGAAVILPATGGVVWFALVVGIAAFVALHRFKAGIVWVVLAGAAAGLGRAWLA